MKLKTMVFILAGSVVMTIAVISCSRQQKINDPVFPEDHAEKLEWWKDSRFGMFIHWGPVSIKGTEIGWSRGREIPVEEYDNLYNQFNPVYFNADEWVSLAKEAGMKYIIFTSKHHDGFCMWDTRYSDYNIMNSPFGRDVMKELSDACKKQGIALGFYHSTCDWHHHDFPLTSPGGSIERDNYNLDRYTEYLKNQSVEIIKNYGPLLVMWYDVPQRFDSIRGQGVIDYIRSVQPGILVNNRSGARGDFDTPEQKIGNFQNDRPWETCMTIGRQWAWKPNDEIKSLEQCLQSLIRSAGGDGNLLFNVGPGPDGKIEPVQAERLKEMGQWLKEYGYSVYGTRGGPFKPADWGVSTRKGNNIYLHLLNSIHSSARIIIPYFGTEIKNCYLASGGEVELKRENNRYSIEITEKSLQPVNTVVILETNEDIMNIEPMEVPPLSLSYKKKVSASSNPNPSWHDVSSVNNGDWTGHFWMPAANDEKPWIEFDLGRPEKVSEVIIFESGAAIQSFEIQCHIGNDFEIVYTGGEVQSGEVINLPEYTTQRLRLTLSEFTELPGIYEVIIL